MISGKQNIKSYFLQVGAPFFKVYKQGTTQSGNPVYESGTDENLTTDRSYQLFEQWLSLQSAGRFTLILLEKPGAKKGNCVQDFELSYAENAPATTQPIMVAGPPPVDPGEVQRQAEKIADERFDKRMLEWELKQAKETIARLEKEVKENGKDDSSTFERVIGKLEPHLGSIIPALLGQPVPAPAPVVGAVPVAPLMAVAGTEEEESEETVRLSKVVQIFSRHDPDWLGTLERMAKKVDENPAVLNSLKMFL